MSEELALAFVDSPHAWNGRWQRHVRDHGPGRVADVIAEARSAFDRDWRVLLVAADHALVNEDFIAAVHQQRRAVVAVLDPADHRAKSRCLDAGVDALVEQDASPEELERILDDAAVKRPAPRIAASRRRTAIAPEPQPGGQVIAVGGASGAPVASVALTLTAVLSRRATAVLLDADETGGTVAPMAGLDPLPNLTSACAAVGEPTSFHLQHCGFPVLAGLVDPGQWHDLNASAVRATVSALAADHDRVVAVVGGMLEPPVGRVDRFGTSRAVLGGTGAVVAVGEATPAGLARLEHWVYAARLVAPRAPLWLVAAGVGRGRWRGAEVEAFLDDLAALDGVRASGTAVLRIDAKRAERAAWDGGIVRGGAWGAGIKRLAREVTA